MQVSQIHSVYGWQRDTLIATEYKIYHFEKGNSVTRVTELPVKVDTYNKYGQVINDYPSMFDQRV